MCLPGAEEFLDALATEGVRFERIPVTHHVDTGAVARLGAAMLTRKPDLVHTHLIHADTHGQVSARLVGIPAISTVHGAHPFYRRAPYRAIAALAGHLARRTIAISHHVRSLLLEEHIASANKVTVIPYGIDTAPWEMATRRRDTERAGYGLGGSDIVIVMASRLIRGKGHETLLSAAALARQQGAPIRVLIAGDGPRRAELEALARLLGVEDAVRFLGFVGDVSSLMAAGDIVAFMTEPSLGEGFGLAALEAMAAGKPVVATTVASLPEIVVSEETGILVGPGDIEGAAAAIGRLAIDAALRGRMGSAGQRRAVDRFSLSAMVDGTLGVYREVHESRLARRAALGTRRPRARDHHG